MTTPWKPWHTVVQVRDDVKTGDLSLSLFAANLYDVAMQKGRRPVYEQPDEFLALTYPTYNLRELARDVVTRLAGKSDKAVRQLELTYGGGKTHTLITLYHLVNDPAHLPNLPAVHEFTSHIGITPPRARIAALTFDQIDVEKGMETRAPNGETRWLRHPWSILAYQLAGSAGLRLLNAENNDQERDSAPAENLLTDLLMLPQHEGLATLILMDEVLMYAHEKVGLSPEWRSRLSNFFQYLTQAVARVDHCAMVASLLATDTRKNDSFGRELAQEFFAIFRREREESVQPVVKEDVAEVLRRRFFTPDSIRERETFRSHVVAALQGITALDDQTRKARKEAENRYLSSYPFHPDLTEVFYTKWTNMESFQRTRGVLRTFALAIRDAEKWDTSPLIGTNIFLNAPDSETLSDAARELTGTAASEEYDGKRQEWAHILEGELTRARIIQQEYTGLHLREIEQAVMAVFLHSQPVGQRAQTRDLLLLTGATRPDKIDLYKGLRQWIDVSWFLDDETTQERNDADELPRSWRLGPEPNLTQMHHDASSRISSDAIEQTLQEQIGKLKWLTDGASAAGARVHTLPKTPKDLEDNGLFRYAILGPSAASESGKPSAEARRFLEEASPGTPRTYRNAVVLAVPSHTGLDAARTTIRSMLGWEEVQRQVKGQELDPRRERSLSTALAETRKTIPERIRQAYCIVVTISDKNDVQAFKLTLEKEPLFVQIKADKRSRIQETPITKETLLPGGPYDLWVEDDHARRVKDLVSRFAQFPRLPKMLNSAAILDTLIEGCKSGIFVMRLMRPDQSYRTFWRTSPDDTALKDASLEVLLPERATLDNIVPDLLAPGVLPELWGDTPECTIAQLCAYFNGETVVEVNQGETQIIPTAPREVVERAVHEAVRQGILWLTAGSSTSIYREDIPVGILTDDAVLQAPPQPIAATAILPPNLPDAWSSGEHEPTTARAIADTLSEQAGKPLPWSIVTQALDGAFGARFLERTEDSAAWPCDVAGANRVRVRLPHYQYTPTGTKKPRSIQEDPFIPAPTAGFATADATLNVDQIQNLGDTIGEIAAAAAGYGITFRLHIALGNETPPTDEVLERVNALLNEVAPGLRVE